MSLSKPAVQLQVGGSCKFSPLTEKGSVLFRLSVPYILCRKWVENLEKTEISYEEFYRVRVNYLASIIYTPLAVVVTVA